MWSLEMIKWLNRDKKEKKPKVKISCQDSDFKPVYKHNGDAGADVKAFKIHGCDDVDPLEFFATFSTDLETGAVKDWSYVLKPHMAVLVECGFKCELPDGYAFLVCPRSGLAIKNYITVLNAPGICDAGYRGAYGVILFNAGQCDFAIHKGDRIAQIVLTKTPQAEFIDEDLSESDRGKGGFGSSGINDNRINMQTQKGGNNCVQIQSNVITDYEKKILLDHLDKTMKDMKDTMKMCQEDLEKSHKELEKDLKEDHNNFKESIEHFQNSMKDLSKACVNSNGAFTSITVTSKDTNKNK